MSDRTRDGGRVEVGTPGEDETETESHEVVESQGQQKKGQETEVVQKFQIFPSELRPLRLRID